MTDPRPPSPPDATNADVLGQFDVRYEQVTSTCDNGGIALTSGTLVITARKGDMVCVEIAGIPAMAGSVPSRMHVKATSRVCETSIDGVDGQFAIEGAVTREGALGMRLVAEYYMQGKPFCVQTWNVLGQRKPGT